VAGIEIDPAQPGYKHIILRPQPGGGLTHVTGKLKTLYGELVSQWELGNGTFEWTVVVPPNTTATVYLPVLKENEMVMNGQGITGSVHEIEAGKYRFIIR
jgi:alpha-L-rhamnosidase